MKQVLSSVVRRESGINDFGDYMMYVTKLYDALFDFGSIFVPLSWNDNQRCALWAYFETIASLRLVIKFVFYYIGRFQH